MATYAVGDIQGCFATLQKLLEKLPFDAERDRLWLSGDLVNRGPRSLEVLRWAKAQGSRLRMVLGNHDLHLLARGLGVGKPKKSDTIEQVLQASDCDELLEWLSQQPVLVREGNVVMVHGGLDPSWTVEQAENLASEIESQLQSTYRLSLLQNMYGDFPPNWDPTLPAPTRLSLALKIFTTIRICGPGGRLAFPFSGPPNLAPRGFFPWFEYPGRQNADATVVFGHWASLGLKIQPKVIALDSGCVWGRELSAVRLEDRVLYQQSKID